jgi:hypothetical protein
VSRCCGRELLHRLNVLLCLPPGCLGPCNNGGCLFVCARVCARVHACVRVHMRTDAGYWSINGITSVKFCLHNNAINGLKFCIQLRYNDYYNNL